MKLNTHSINVIEKKKEKLWFPTPKALDLGFNTDKILFDNFPLVKQK